MTTANTTTRRGRPMKNVRLTSEQINNALHASVYYNHETEMYDYRVGVIFSGSVKNHDYLRNRVMRGNLQSLEKATNGFTRPLAIHTTFKDGSQTMQYVMKS